MEMREATGFASLYLPSAKNARLLKLGLLQRQRSYVLAARLASYDSTALPEMIMLFAGGVYISSCSRTAWRHLAARAVAEVENFESTEIKTLPRSSVTEESSYCGCLWG